MHRDADATHPRRDSPKPSSTVMLTTKNVASLEGRRCQSPHDKPSLLRDGS